MNFIRLFLCKIYFQVNCRPVAIPDATCSWMINNINNNIGNNNINIIRNKSDEIVHIEGNEPTIPPYVERQGENVELKRAR